MRLENKSLANRWSHRSLVVVVMVSMMTAICMCNSSLDAQVQTPAEPRTQKVERVAFQQPVPNANQPYLLSSRLHLQMGTNKGYLVVRVDLAEGSYIHSLTQKGDARPTKLTVTQSPKFRVVGEFSPDRPAEVTAEPGGKQSEKHKSLVQFFAPIEIAPETEVGGLTAEVVFDGQVCTANNFCMPIMGKKVAGKFAGYFRGKAQESPAQGSTRSAQLDSTDSSSDQLQR